MYNCPKTPEEKSAVKAEAAANEHARIDDLKRSRIDPTDCRIQSLHSSDFSPVLIFRKLHQHFIKLFRKKVLAETAELFWEFSNSLLALIARDVGSRRSYVLRAGQSCGQGNPVRVQGRTTFVGHSDSWCWLLRRNHIELPCHNVHGIWLSLPSVQVHVVECS